MTQAQFNVAMAVLTVIGVMGAVGGAVWVGGGKTEGLCRDVKLNANISREAYIKAQQNENGITEVKTMLRANFDEVLRRLERIEESQDRNK